MKLTGSAESLRTLMEAVAIRMIDACDELSALDRAMGDGDHGLNMKRGFEAVQNQVDSIAARPLPEALKMIGMTMISKVGGASGPIFGTLFTTLGKSLPAEPTLTEVAAALDLAIAAIKRLGKAEPGMKTLLDVLVPVQIELARTATESGIGSNVALVATPASIAQRISRCAVQAADATASLKSIRGRGSFLGDRSIGHVDPGARSSALIIMTVCEVLAQ